MIVYIAFTLIMLVILCISYVIGYYRGIDVGKHIKALQQTQDCKVCSRHPRSVLVKDTDNGAIFVIDANTERLYEFVKYAE